jgi:hypothetical protein
MICWMLCADFAISLLAGIFFALGSGGNDRFLESGGILRRFRGGIVVSA